MSKVEIRRVYDDPERGRNEYRVLVDRLWPRGVRKTSLDYDHWCKVLAPSAELRRWFGHRKSRWDEFKKRYREELKADEVREAIDDILQHAGKKTLVLLFAAKDTEHTHALVLQDVFANARQH